jgi:MFS family permease
MLASLRVQLSLLTALQALLFTNNTTLIVVNGLAGLAIADTMLMATLPVTGYVLGAAIWAMPAAAVMNRFGRRMGYTIGSVVAMIGATLAWYAMTQKSLPMLCFATFVLGLYNAFGASLRFAAADISDKYKPSFRAKAISLVVTGGIAGGVLGPELAKSSSTLLETRFAGTYLSLIGFAVLSLLLVQLLRLPALGLAKTGTDARPLREILSEPRCWFAIMTAALGYGIMNLLMVSTPLAMEVCRHPFESAAFVIEWHVVGMFAPGLITGSLIARFGVLQIIAIGCVLMLACVGIALSGVDLMQFVAALFLLGVGWNFMYTGGTTLLTSSYRPSERIRVQGFMDVCVFSVMVTSSASSGALLFVNGWTVLNLMSLPFILLVLGCAIWLGSRIGWRTGKVVAA